MSGLNINVGDLVTEQTDAADVDLHWDFELATARALFLTDGTRIFFNYAANPIFETMDIARFYTDANVQLKDAALAYAASQANVGIPAITNTAEWLAAFVSLIEVKLTEIHERCLALDMHAGTSNTLVSVGEYWALGETMAAPLLLAREADPPVNGFSAVPLILNDVLYFNLTVLFEFIHQQIYRVNLRLVAPITPIPYPVALLPDHVRFGTLVDMHAYVALFESDTSFALTINSVSAVVDFELDSATLIAQLKLLLNLEFAILGNYIVVYSVQPFSVTSSPFPAGQQLIGKGYLRYALTSANAVTTVSPLWLNKAGTRFLAGTGQYTTDGKWVLSQADFFSAVDERGHDSSAAYAELGFSRLRTIPAAAFLDFYQCATPEFTLATPNKIPMTYAVLPDESGPITVSIVVNLVNSDYYFNYTGDAAGLIDAFSLDPYISVTSDSVIMVLTPHTMSAGPGNAYPLTFLSGYFHEAVYVAMSPLPVAAITLEAPVEFLGTQVAAGPYAPQALADALNQTGFYVVLQNGFLKIESLRPFSTGVWAEAGFYESRTATLVLPRLTLS
jgi:hypothetical protein